MRSLWSVPPLWRRGGVRERQRTTAHGAPPIGLASAEKLAKRIALKAVHPLVPSSLGAGGAGTGTRQGQRSSSSVVPSGVIGCRSEVTTTTTLLPVQPRSELPACESFICACAMRGDECKAEGSRLVLGCSGG